MKNARLLPFLSLLFLCACEPASTAPTPPAPISQPAPSEELPDPPPQPPPPPAEQPPVGQPPVEQPPVEQPPVEPPPPPPLPPPPPPPPVPEVERPFVLPPVQQAVPEWELEMPPEVLASFYANTDTPEQDALFKAEGQTYRVKVRLRGASARTFPKKSWNVNFEKNVTFQGRTSLNLVAEYADATMLAEKISYDLLYAMRVPAPKTTFVRLKLNGRYEGPFLEIEQVNKAFLKNHGMPDDDATIYRTGWKDTEFKTWKAPYQGKWLKKTNEKSSDQPLWDVLDVINHTPEPQLTATLPRHFELEWYLRSMTLDALMSNNFVEDSESYFIHDKATGRWYYVPWDLNNVDARWWVDVSVEHARPKVDHPLFNFTLTDGWTQEMYDERKGMYPGYLPVFSNLGTRVVTNPELRARLEARLDKALQELFTPEVMHPYIDKLHALLDPHMNGAPYTDYRKFTAGRQFLKDYVVKRRKFIRDELKLDAEQKPGLVLEGFSPAGGWVELRNRGTEAVQLRGLVLTTNLRVSLRNSDHAPTQVRAPVGAVLPERTLAPGETVRFTASELGIQFAAKGELGVFDGVSVVGVKDLLFYGPLPAGQHYVRGEKGWEAR
jgi:spore coat protein H